MTYPAFEKIPRFNRDVTITEKIDGTNALIDIRPVDSWREDDPGVIPLDIVGDLAIYAGSRTRYIYPDADNYGFAAWVRENQEELIGLGPGLHYGEWYGKGIQRGYGLDEKRFALFNTHRWYSTDRPDCCDVVPILWEGNASRLNDILWDIRYELEEKGSLAVPGFMRPEGVIIYHHAAKQYFKVLLEGDDTPKGLAA